MIICTNWSFLLRGSKHWQLRQQCCFSMLYLCVMLHYFQHNMKPAWTDVFYLTLIYFILYFCYHKIITWFCSQKGWNHLKKFSSCEVNFDTQTYAFDQLLSVLTLLTLWGNGENQKVQDKQRYHILAVPIFWLRNNTNGDYFLMFILSQRKRTTTECRHCKTCSHCVKFNASPISWILLCLLSGVNGD